MNKLILTFIVLFAAALNAQDFKPSIVSSNFHTGYIPDGFDTNDHVQIVGEGTYSNTCFRPAQQKITIDKANKKITVEPRAYQYDGMCAMMLVPYSQEINLGVMDAGRYEVEQKGLYSSTIGHLNIRVATNSEPDDHLYAPVSQAYFLKVGDEHQLTVRGQFTSSCWVMDKLEIDVQVRNKVVVVQPISKIDETVACADVMTPFQETLSIKNMPKGRYLLHVRSTNAKAVNNLVDVR